jgi:hypothetical protein
MSGGDPNHQRRRAAGELQWWAKGYCLAINSRVQRPGGYNLHVWRVPGSARWMLSGVRYVENDNS